LYIGFAICLTVIILKYIYFIWCNKKKCNVIGSFLCFSMSKYFAAELVKNRL